MENSSGTILLYIEFHRLLNILEWKFSAILKMAKPSRRVIF